MTVPMKSSESATITVWVRTGSRNEEKRINGISHFLEHMVFKGSKKRPSARAISETVDSFGGEFNAATNKDWTNFYIKSRIDRIEMAADVLSDMVLNPILDPEEIEREKGTIIQEIAMYQDTPMIDIYNVFEDMMFAGSPLGRDVAGIPESVRTIKRNDFLKYRATHYHPSEMLVTISGGVSEKDASSLVKEYFGGLKKSVSKFKGENFQSAQKRPQLSVKYKKSDQAHIILGFFGNGRGYKGRYAQSVLSTILAGPMSSRLFLEIRERRGLAYAVQPALDRYQDVGYLGAYAGTDPSKAKETIKVMIDQLYGLAAGKYPISKSEILKAKEYIKGHIALSLEDTNAVNEFFGMQAMFLPKILSPEELYKTIDKVSIEDVMSEANHLFDPKNLNLAIIGPYSKETDKEAFKKLIL